MKRCPKLLLPILLLLGALTLSACGMLPAPPAPPAAPAGLPTPPAPPRP